MHMESKMTRKIKQLVERARAPVTVPHSWRRQRQE